MAKWKQLIEAREEMSLSQTEAAERLQVGLLTYQKWELGKAKPQPQNRRRLRELFPLLDRPRSEKQGSLTDTETSVQSHSKTAVDRAQAQGGHQFVPMSSTALVVSTPPVLLTVSNRPEETDQLSDLPGSMRDALWTPAFLDHLTCSEKRSAIRQVLKDYDSMNTTNKNYQITRREAIRSLARLPMITLGLSIPGTIVQTSRYGDALAHCAAALEGCWELWKDNNTGDIPLAFQYVSKYLPLLKTIAKDSALYRKEALHLAAQYAVLHTLLGRACVGLAEVTLYAKEALALSQETRDISLQLSAYIKLAWAYVDEKKYAFAFKTMQEGEDTLKRNQKTQNLELSSGIIGAFYSAMAMTQVKNGKNSEHALAVATDSTTGSDPSTFVVFAPSTQLKEAALICCSKGDQEQAMKWLAKRMDPETLAPRITQNERGRIETINILTLSMLKSKERDMEKIIHHWSAGIEGAKALRHEHAFNQAVANFEGMELIWPGEKRITELRDLIVHW